MKKISVCIVTHNNQDDIESVLNSIYNNSCDIILEVFVVDNNSCDDTVKLIKKNFPQVNLIVLPDNKGFSYGHNQVLNKIDSDFHVILNPDITFNTNVLYELSDYLQKHSEVATIVPNLLNDDGTIQNLPKRTPKFKYLISGRLERFGDIFKKWRDEYTRRNESFDKPIEVDFCSGCFIMLRTQIFKKINGFDEKFFMYFEDADLTRRVQQYGKTIFHPSIYATHSWKRYSSKHLKYFFIHIISMIKYFIKWH